MAKNEPQFAHHCHACRFLGRYDTPQRNGEPIPVDLYSCPTGALGDCVIARYGNEAGEYVTMPAKWGEAHLGHKQGEPPGVEAALVEACRRHHQAQLHALGAPQMVALTRGQASELYNFLVHAVDEAGFAFLGGESGVVARYLSDGGDASVLLEAEAALLGEDWPGPRVLPPLVADAMEYGQEE